jgi:hypothetical protein
MGVIIVLWARLLLTGSPKNKMQDGRRGTQDDNSMYSGFIPLASLDMYVELLSKTVEWKEVMKSYAITHSLSKAKSDVKWRRQKTQDDTNAKDH